MVCKLSTYDCSVATISLNTEFLCLLSFSFFFFVIIINYCSVFFVQIYSFFGWTLFDNFGTNNSQNYDYYDFITIIIQQTISRIIIIKQWKNFELPTQKSKLFFEPAIENVIPDLANLFLLSFNVIVDHCIPPLSPLPLFDRIWRWSLTYLFLTRLIFT